MVRQRQEPHMNSKKAAESTMLGMPAFHYVAKIDFKEIGI